MSSIEKTFGFFNVFVLAIFIPSEKQNYRLFAISLNREIDSVSVVEFDLSKTLIQLANMSEVLIRRDLE